MSLSKRITRLIDAAYENGQSTVTTTLQFPEMFDQEELDRLITDLRSLSYIITHDDVFHDMTIQLPSRTFAERANLIANNTDSVIRKQIESISEDILTAARLGYVDTEEDFYDLADPSIVESIHEHFAREGFNVSRTDDPKYNHIQLRIRWGN